MLSQNVANAYAIKMNAPLVTMLNSAGVHPPLRSQGLCSSMLETAKTQKHLTLWSMYPASVRGRVFDGIGGDPVMSFGGGW